MHARKIALLSTLLLTAAVAAACAKKKHHDPINFSQPVGITLNTKSGDVSGGRIVEIKNINTESGNPFGAFINDARAAIGNHDPGSIDLTALSLTLESNGTGATTLQQIFKGDVVIAFQMNTGTGLYPAGTANNPTGTNQSFVESFTTDNMTATDYQGFLGGQFKVVLSGSAATGFATAGANVNLLSTFDFEAFQ